MLRWISKSIPIIFIIVALTFVYGIHFNKNSCQLEPWWITVSFKHLRLCICVKWCKVCFFIIIDDHKLWPPSGKIQFWRQLIKQTSNAECVSTAQGTVKKRKHQTYPRHVMPFYHLWIIFLHIHQNCGITSLQISLNPLMESAA